MIKQVSLMPSKASLKLRHCSCQVLASCLHTRLHLRLAPRRCVDLLPCAVSRRLLAGA